MSMQDFDTSHLDGKAKKIADGIVKWLTDRYGAAPDGGGCKVFYTPQEWKTRGESYGTESILVLVHDGGDLYPVCDYNCGNYKTMDEFRVFLEREFGVYTEQCTSWYSAVYE